MAVRWDAPVFIHRFSEITLSQNCGVHLYASNVYRMGTAGFEPASNGFRWYCRLSSIKSTAIVLHSLGRFKVTATAHHRNWPDILLVHELSLSCSLQPTLATNCRFRYHWVSVYFALNPVAVGKDLHLAI